MTHCTRFPSGYLSTPDNVIMLQYLFSIENVIRFLFLSCLSWIGVDGYSDSQSAKMFVCVLCVSLSCIWCVCCSRKDPGAGKLPQCVHGHANIREVPILNYFVIDFV